MKTLFPAQQRAVDFSVRAIQRIGACLNSSETGTGKTLMALETARALGIPFGIVARKATIPDWEDAAQQQGLEPLFVRNLDKLRRGLPGVVSFRGSKRKTFKWHLPPGALLVFDECQDVRGLGTQNQNLFIAAVRQGYRILALSATPAKTVVDLRALGFALRLHSLNSPTAQLPSWFGFLRKLGCSQDPWGQWCEPKNKAAIDHLHKLMHLDRVVKVRRTELPSAFRESFVSYERVDFGEEVQKAYGRAGLTSEMVTAFVETGKWPEHTAKAVEILYARQLAESAKLPLMADMADDLVAEGASVVLMVNFRESATRLHASIPGSVLVVGGQDATERKEGLAAFQDDTKHVVICTSSSGGTGVNLHDTKGSRRRVTIISPDWDPIVFRQCLGRTVRAGMRSDAFIRVLFASGTVEESVLGALRSKEESMDRLWETTPTNT